MVAVVCVPSDQKDALDATLQHAERYSQRRIRKWSKSNPSSRMCYMQTLLVNDFGTLRVYAQEFQNSTEYTRITAATIVAAIRGVCDEQSVKPTITIDGLNNKEREKVRKRLKGDGIRYRKIRGMRDENSALLRLADSFAGLLRDASEGDPQSGEIAEKFRLLGVLTTQK